MSEILNIAHDMAKDLFKVGAMDEITMREIDALCLPPKRPFRPEDIRRIRAASHVSQAVFAAIMGIHIRKTLNHSAIGGAFRFGIAQPFSGRRLVEWMTNFRARHFLMPYGDQAIFIRRQDFIEMGGYKPMPIMEDYEFIRRLRRKGRIAIADATVLTSGRRWFWLGVLRTTLINQLVIAGYHCGVAPEKLRKFYINAKNGQLRC